MNSQRRVTLRCLCDDLRSDWHDVHQQRRFGRLRAGIAAGSSTSDTALLLDGLPTTAQAAHPLVASFSAAFAGDDPDVRRESISGLSDPHWWKQKVARWRGAATDAAIVGAGEVWLCAGGLRAAGDQRDFYATFMETVSGHGADRYLPAAEDRRVQEIEALVARRDAWSAQVKLSVVVALDSVLRESAPLTVHIPPPAPHPTTERIAHLELSVERLSDDDEEIIELTLVVSHQDRSRPHLVGLAIETALSVVSPVAEDWRVLPAHEADEVWVALVGPEAVMAVRESVVAGELVESLAARGAVHGVHAHYTERGRIVDASVAGDAVPGLCGQWFVPVADPDTMPVCEMCVRRYGELER